MITACVTVVGGPGPGGPSFSAGRVYLNPELDVFTGWVKCVRLRLSDGAAQTCQEGKEEKRAHER